MYVIIEYNMATGHKELLFRRAYRKFAEKLADIIQRTEDTDHTVYVETEEEWNLSLLPSSTQPGPL